MAVKLKVFLDTNIIIAGVASPSGASAAVLDLSETGFIIPVVSEQVIHEADRNVQEKLPRLLARYRSFIKNMSPFLTEPPTLPEIQQAAEWINAKDAPILAAAIKGRVDYLVTLDIKDFHRSKVKKNAPFPIVRPNEFLKLYREALFG